MKHRMLFASRTRKRYVPLSLIVCLASLLILVINISTAGTAGGFTLNKGLTNETPLDRSDDLLDAARWTDAPFPYVGFGVRGLGGGIEYSISQDFCTKLIPQFIDDPSCEDIRLMVQRAFDVWAQDNPKLSFKDVSNQVVAELPPAWAAEPWQGFGAEIDLLALDPDQLAEIKDVGGWTKIWYLFADPQGTNGRLLPGNTITSADIVINSQASFYSDPERAVSGSNDFTALLLHEIGHTFGIGHSNPEGDGNFDSDYDPSNPMPIDCESPQKGLGLSPIADLQSVMNPDLQEHRNHSTSLSEDESAALRFLYPVC